MIADKQRIDSTFENYEYCYCKDQQQPCNCGFNSNNNSNSLSQDQEVDSNNALIFDRNSQKQNSESILDAISVEKGIDLNKINYCQNSLDVASLDEIVNEDLLTEELDKNITFKLDENDNQSFEIIKREEETKNSTKQLSLTDPIRV